MVTITTVAQLQKLISKHKSNGKTVGFSPTMGALHNGHMSLIAASNAEYDISVCSVFVNPTQFNEETDLDKYPRTLEADEKLLKKNGVDIVFAPPVDEIYPKGLNTKLNLDFKGLDKEMEGEFRPGHFEGVAEVVKRLIDVVNPDGLFMGQKDFQQFTLVHFMMQHFNLECSLRVIPIVRKDSGLAMSSRNVRLTKENKENASEIYKVLKYVKRNKNKKGCKELQDYAMKRLAKMKNFKPEYFTIADAKTLQSIDHIGDSDYVVACTALWAGDVRLIDNMVLKKPKDLKIFVK